MANIISNPASLQVIQEQGQLGKIFSQKTDGSSFQEALLQGAKSPDTPKDDKTAKLEEKAKDLESVFLSKVFEPFFSKDSTGFIFGGGAGGDIYRQWMVDEYAKVFTKTGGVGLSKDITKSLLALQEVKS